jgi:hypothetical protein
LANLELTDFLAVFLVLEAVCTLVEAPEMFEPLIGGYFLEL